MVCGHKHSPRKGPCFNCASLLPIEHCQVILTVMVDQRCSGMVTVWGIVRQWNNSIVFTHDIGAQQCSQISLSISKSYLCIPGMDIMPSPPTDDEMTITKCWPTKVQCSHSPGSLLSETQDEART